MEESTSQVQLLSRNFGRYLIRELQTAYPPNSTQLFGFFDGLVSTAYRPEKSAAIAKGFRLLGGCLRSGQPLPSAKPNYFGELLEVLGATPLGV